ncbi:MAG: carbohydrate ABC transporter permease [Haloechinothrix sp.]
MFRQLPDAERQRRRAPYAMIAPAVIYLLAFLAYPMGEGLRLSVTDTGLLNPRQGRFVGLDNYVTALTSGDITRVLSVTLFYAAASVAITVVLGVIAAAVMNRPFPGRTLIRSAVTIPWTTPQVAVALVFAWMFNNQYGVINYLLTTFGLTDHYHRWLDNVDLAMPAVLATTVWMIFPFTALVLLAAMQSIPEDLYESARIDGADPLNQFRAVTLPAIAPTLLVVTAFLSIWAIRRFEVIWLLTQGGPAQTTSTLVVDLYRQAFRLRRLGYAAAIGIVGVALAAIVAAGFVWAEARRKKAADA